MSIASYLEEVNKHYQSGHASEHTYRGNFADLIKQLAPNVHITNEPNNVTDCGNPDYVITCKKIPVGFIEAKDLGKDLNSKQYKEQFGRYRKALDNLIITDYIRFQFYKNGEKVHEISIAEIDGKHIKPLPDNFDQFTNLINDFCTFITQTIKSPKVLAEMMAAKARLLENILESAITSDEEQEENTSLKQQYETFKNILIHDLTPQGFADIYAQTLAYGMFAARLHDKTLDTFSRQEAAELIPKSNPFLRKLFSHVAGVDIDERMVTTVDNLADVFRATNIEALLIDFGKATQTQDPIIHFYETFLAEYDPKLRKARGVWYTPEPVVKFIVRAVDEILKTEFGLKDGLANTSKTSVKIKTDQPDRRTKSGYVEIDKEVHRVQVLDPATGTGTFLAEVVRFIYGKKFKAMQGAWSGYIEEHLIPRLNGFELLMAPYSMAHLKLDMLLTETGYQSKKNPRFKIFLTNSLEEHHPDTGTLFSSWLSTEANEANSVKRDTPIMCVIGNPPYSGVSSNNGKWISELIEDYKYVNGEHFNEKKHWLNDDYVKFLRYGQHFIEKNKNGVLAFINPHGFLDNPTFRGMRWNLLKTYDRIYIIDLHGNSNKKETAPDGSADVNIFDIKQGVSINIFIKTGKKKAHELGQVLSYDLYGKRNLKYEFLSKGGISNIDWKEVIISSPNFAFKESNIEYQTLYNEGFKLTELFTRWTTGVQTSRDKIALSFNSNEAKYKLNDFCNDCLSTEEIRKKYFTQTSQKYPAGDTRDWKLSESRKNSDLAELQSSIKSYTFRPFDTRKIIFHDNILSWSRYAVSRHLFEDNISLITARSNKKGVDHFFISNNPSDVKCGERTTGSIFCPLYLYPESNDQFAKREPNLNPEIVKQIMVGLGIAFCNEKGAAKNTFAPIDILDYIYAILYSPTYRLKYKEFLKIDFPRVPYPKDKNTFWRLVKLGEEIRQIHLLESPVVEQYITQYSINGDNAVHKPKYGDNKVYINDTQYFDGIPLKIWEFYIGGYQPAQKWLKDRSGRTLSFDDILHYQKIIVALNETDRIMQEIDKISFE